jgi:predicted DNA-binding WGR domain protein
MIPWFMTHSFFYLFCFKFREAYQAARFEKESRYYVIRLEKDLLEDWTITIINGRIKSKLGQSRTHAFPSYSDAFDQFCNLAKTRYQRGYYLKTITSDSPLLLQLLLYLLLLDQQQTVRPRTKIKLKESSIVRAAAPLPKETNPQMGFEF